MIKAHPLSGVGFNHFVVRMQEFASQPLKAYQFYPVHNIYLLIAAENGLDWTFMFSVLYRIDRY